MNKNAYSTIDLSAHRSAQMGVSVKNKKIIWIAVAFVILGIILSTIGFAIGGIPGFYINREGIHPLDNSQGETKTVKMEKTKIAAFTKMDIAIEYADFNIIPSDGYYLEYALLDQGIKPQMNVENQNFMFKEQFDSFNSNRFINFMNFDVSHVTDSYYVNLYVPKDQYFDTIKMNVGYGDVLAEELKGNFIDAILGYGDFKSKKLQGGDMNITLESGNMQSDVMEAETFVVKNEYGDITAESFKGQKLDAALDCGTIHIKDIKAEDITIQNEYGDILNESLDGLLTKITLDSGHLKAETWKTDELQVSSEYGNVTIKEMICKESNFKLSSGDLEIGQADTTNLNAVNEYGNVEIGVINPLKEYDLKLNTEYGTVYIDGDKTHNDDETDNQYITSMNTGKFIEIGCDSGDIEVSHLD